MYSTLVSFSKRKVGHYLLVLILFDFLITPKLAYVRTVCKLKLRELWLIRSEIGVYCPADKRLYSSKKIITTKSYRDKTKLCSSQLKKRYQYRLICSSITALNLF